ncbi:MAG: EutP/PduV family microcompartment system protein [Desulfovibrio sp.]|jgi:ethanolamine utilization protein EutP|nr:EutP/PduV family microcompartment system protein [Desulfovibrio sp.]
MRQDKEALCARNLEDEDRPVMVVGPSGAGKSTLLKSLGLMDGQVKKTEALVYLDKAIDTPGEMLSVPRYYNAIILNSVRASLILFVVDAGRRTRLPARIALALKAPVLGVIAKTDAASPAELAEAEATLKGAGVEDLVRVSAKSGEGLEELQRRLFSRSRPGTDRTYGRQPRGLGPAHNGGEL